ncbi:larval cuticle protein A3A-like [Oppia nitens]|uniref:larval cuticle protein A3A-like n=1 Tax=Oppia nitens TaxID=1686743 RepID=UPI0023DA1A77|nr:larval cuticle protein A3A-like [Oppia nitens]
MFKFISLALVITLVNGQNIFTTNGGLNSRLISSLGHNQDAQYVLVQVQPQQDTHSHYLSPYLSHQTVAVQPQTTIVRAAAPAPRIIAAPQPKPIVYSAPAPVARVQEQYGPAEPYSFGFQSTDEQGNSLSRQEQSDGSGAVKGSYSYVDSNGLNRIVEYIADSAGYRATVKTNEPGTANANPADVQIAAEEPPSAVQQLVAAYSTPRANKLNKA